MRFKFAAFMLLLAACSQVAGVRLSDAAAQGVAGWAAGRHLAPGGEQTVKLPAEYAALSTDGTATIGRLADGRTCVLLKTAIGYKDNFQGVVTCTAPLKPYEIVRSPNYNRDFISLAGLGVFEELYVAGKRNDRTYDVFFDLN